MAPLTVTVSVDTIQEYLAAQIDRHSARSQCHLLLQLTLCDEIKDWSPDAEAGDAGASGGLSGGVC